MLLGGYIALNMEESTINQLQCPCIAKFYQWSSNTKRKHLRDTRSSDLPNSFAKIGDNKNLLRPFLNPFPNDKF